MMKTIHALVDLLRTEEQARTCLTRKDAQECIRHAEQMRRQIWGPHRPMSFEGN